MVNHALPVAETNGTIYEYPFQPGDLSTPFSLSGGGGGLYTVTSAVEVIDPAATGFPLQIYSDRSLPLLLTLDQTAPVANAPDLQPCSDAGIDDDNQTYINQPTFQGTGEPGAKVQLKANGCIVGHTVVDSEGNWAVTSAPLVIGDYSITVRFEDLAGNYSEPSAPLEITITETPPQPLPAPMNVLSTGTVLGSSAQCEVTNLGTQEVTVNAAIITKFGNTIGIQEVLTLPAGQSKTFSRSPGWYGISRCEVWGSFNLGELVIRHYNYLSGVARDSSEAR
jgi:hypothetical protein